MDDFVAIDFETANGNRSSICSVGVVFVSSGEIVGNYYSLIRPYPNYYSGFCVDVHGITAEDTYDAREFPEVWAEIQPRLQGLPLVAHNARFDEGCLRAAHRIYDIYYPEYVFYDTLMASRKNFGRSLPNHKLPTVAAACGYDLTNHHHALADAEACALIAIKLL